VAFLLTPVHCGCKLDANHGWPGGKEKTGPGGISERIRHVRLQRGLSMDALGKQAGSTKSYVSQIENQKREPTIGTLVTIAHALGVNVFSLIGGEKLLEEEETPAIVKAKDRRMVSIPSKATNIIYESINYKKN
jgi:transcriptional regulator with XRE-family HTH domain